MKWIKISEQLPEFDKEVLVLKYYHDSKELNNFYTYDISYLEKVYQIQGSDKYYTFWRAPQGTVNIDYYRYWMPLPEFPNE